MESTGPDAVVVDEENGVIRNVLVLGRTSPNTPTRNGSSLSNVTEGTHYTDGAIKSACRIFEGAKVRKNHPDRRTPYAERDVEDGLGVLRNCRSTPQGVRADFHYNRRHPFNAQLVEDVKRRMGQWGFSPNAAGVGEVKDGVFVVEELAHVRSVDLVSDPATTVNLWEQKLSERTMTTVAFRTLLESQLPRVKGAPRKTLVSFLELDYMAAPEKKPGELVEDGEAAPGANMGDMPVEAPAETADPMEAISAGFATALKSLVDGMTSGDMTVDEAVNKFKELAKTFDKLKSGSGSSTPATTTEGEDEDAKKDDEKAEVKEGKTAKTLALEAENAALKREKAFVALCEKHNFRPTGVETKAAVQLAESEQIDFIKAAVARERKPVSGDKARVTIGGDKGKSPPAAAQSADEFLAAITTR